MAQEKTIGWRQDEFCTIIRNKASLKVVYTRPEGGWISHLALPGRRVVPVDQMEREGWLVVPPSYLRPINHFLGGN